MRKLLAINLMSLVLVGSLSGCSMSNADTEALPTTTEHFEGEETEYTQLLSEYVFNPDNYRCSTPTDMIGDDYFSFYGFTQSGHVTTCFLYSTVYAKDFCITYNDNKYLKLPYLCKGITALVFDTRNLCIENISGTDTTFDLTEVNLKKLGQGQYKIQEEGYYVYSDGYTILGCDYHNRAEIAVVPSATRIVYLLTGGSDDSK